MRPADAETCRAPAAVCEARAAVFAIASDFDPAASAVLVAPGLLVTNRHTVADESTVRIRDGDGETVEGQVVPSAYGGDLILVRAPGLAGEALEIAPSVQDPVYGIGVDAGPAGRPMRVFEPGETIAAPAAEAPLARWHHWAESQPGMSGGALVDADGRLIGVVTAGGEGRNNAIPVAAIRQLEAQSGPDHAEAHRKIGAAYRACIEGDAALGPGQAGARLDALVAACRSTGNSQFYDAVAKRLGTARRYEEAIRLFELSLAQDPNRPNTLLSLAITYQFAGRGADALPTARRLIELLPQDRQSLFLALRVGKEAGDAALSDRALALITQHHPDAAAAAKTFLSR